MSILFLQNTADSFIEVPDEVAEAMAEFDRKEAAYRLRTYRHKAYYSLDREDGIEHSALFVSLSPLWELARSVDGPFRQIENWIKRYPDTKGGCARRQARRDFCFHNKKIEELDTRRQKITKAIADLSVETISQ